MQRTAQLVDRAVGAVVASAAGDALGAGYEFTDGVPGDVAMIGGGLGGFAPGEWTDDTQMATAILSAVASANDRGGELDLDEVATGFLTWMAGRPADVGIQTRRVLSAATSPAHLREVVTAFHADNPTAEGNGSLMRTGPVALLHLEDGRDADAAAAASSISALTHPADNCRAACVLWTLAIRTLVRGRTGGPPVGEEWADLVAEGLPHVDGNVRDEWKGLIDECRTGDPTRFAAKNGWVVRAFQQALATAIAPPVPDGPAAPLHLRRVLEQAVRPGHDADTVAAIAGALVGAAWGAMAVPMTWRRQLCGDLVRADEVRRVGGRDLDHLARRIAMQTSPGEWPGCPTMATDPAHAGKRAVAHDAEARLTFGSFAAVREMDLDDETTVVSLCRMGEDDLPTNVERIHVGLIDSPSDNAHPAWLLADTADGVNALLEEGRRVVVHCVAAENRAPAIMATWLARHRGVPVDEALAQTRDRLGAHNRTLAQFVADAVALGR